MPVTRAVAAANISLFPLGLGCLPVISLLVLPWVQAGFQRLQALW